MTDRVPVLNMDEILNCMHCGFCLPTCPTYEQTGLETQSPRGRIALMKAVAEQKLPVDDEFASNMYACLGCRACETACPAGVKYGQLLEDARELVEDVKRGDRRRSFRRDLALKRLFMHPGRMRLAGNLLWAVQASGLQRLANRTGMVRILPKEMAEMQRAVDPVASPGQRKGRQAVIPARRSQPRVPRVGVFTGCVMDVLFHQTNEATARILAHAGCEVVFLEGTACCGALHAHAGEKASAIDLAKQNIEAFEEAGVDFMVNNAGGCGAALKEYAVWLNDHPRWSERAKRFVDATRDVSELLAELPDFEFTKRLDLRVTYQDSCHLAHGQGVRTQPRDLLRRIPGVTYVELPRADSCCGSAGIYNITNFEMSMDILDTKMNHVRGTMADVVVTSNPGCLLQMKQGIIRAGLEGKTRLSLIHI